MYIYSLLVLIEEQQVAIQLFYRYKVAKRSFPSQLGIKERIRNLELSSKSKEKQSYLPLFYMAEEVHSMFLPVSRGSCSGRFSTRTAPQFIGSRRACLCTATLTSPAQPQTGAQRVFSKNPRENNHFIYLRGGKCWMLTPPVFLWQKLQFSFFFHQNF